MTYKRITVPDVLPARTSAPEAPQITVFVPLHFPGMDDESRELVLRFTRSALDTLIALGARLDVVDISSDAAVVLPDHTAGVVFLGGGDVDPALYGHLEDVPSLYGVDRATDDRTLDALAASMRRDLPILGICRGSQMINVHLGGTLVPDLGPDTPHHGRPGEPLFLDDHVTVENGCRLRQVLGRSDVVVRNGHHQAVDRLGDGLVVSARGIDGVVEAVEHPDRWIIGVQWHPEDTDGSAVDRLAIFGALMEEVRSRARAAASLRM